MCRGTWRVHIKKSHYIEPVSHFGVHEGGVHEDPSFPLAGSGRICDGFFKDQESETDAAREEGTTGACNDARFPRIKHINV